MVYCMMNSHVVSPILINELYCKSIAKFRCFRNFSDHYKLFEELDIDFQLVAQFYYNFFHSHPTSLQTYCSPH